MSGCFIFDSMRKTVSAHPDHPFVISKDIEYLKNLITEIKDAYKNDGKYSLMACEYKNTGDLLMTNEALEAFNYHGITIIQGTNNG